MNFRPVKMDADFSIERYAIDVSNELLWALEGLVGEGERLKVLRKAKRQSRAEG